MTARRWIWLPRGSPRGWLGSASLRVCVCLCSQRKHPSPSDASARTYPKRKRRVSCVTVSFSMSGQVLNVRGSRNDGGASPASRAVAGKLPFVCVCVGGTIRRLTRWIDRETQSIGGSPMDFKTIENLKTFVPGSWSPRSMPPSLPLGRCRCSARRRRRLKAPSGDESLEAACPILCVLCQLRGGVKGRC